MEVSSIHVPATSGRPIITTTKVAPAKKLDPCGLDFARDFIVQELVTNTNSQGLRFIDEGDVRIAFLSGRIFSSSIGLV